MRVARTAIALAVLLTAATTAHAVPIAGLGDPLTNAFLAGGSQEGFDSVASGMYSSLTLGNVTYIGVDADFTIGPDFNGNYNTTGGKSVFNDFDLVPAQFRFNFAAPIDAFGFNWGAADNSWTLRAYDAANNLLETYIIPGTFASNAGEYYGIATAGMSYATLTDNKNNISSGDYVFIDRFTTNLIDIDAVPEPGTLSLLGVGLAAWVRARRRRASQGTV